MSSRPHEYPAVDLPGSLACRCPRRRIGRILAGVALSGMLFGLQARAIGETEPPPDPALVARVRAVLHTLVTPPCSDPTVVERELDQLGEGAVRVLCSLDHGFDAPVQVMVMARVRARRSDPTVSSWLAGLAGASDSVTTRTAAYRALEEFGTRDALSGLLDARTEESLSVRRCANRAVVAVLRRSDTQKTYELVRSRLTSGDGALRDDVIFSVARADSIIGLNLLCELLGEDREQNRLLLTAIAGMSVRPGDDRLALLIRPFLSATDPETRERAISALANLHDEASAERFLGLLEAGDRGVARAAHAGLRRLAASELPADPVRWQTWLGAERAWWKEEAPGCQKAMWGSNRNRIRQAIHSCALHPLYRFHFKERMEVLTGSPDQGIRDAAEAARIQLGLVEPARQEERAAPSTGGPSPAAHPGPRPSTRRPPVQLRERYLYLLLFGSPIILLLLLKVSGFAPLERLRGRRVEGPIVVSLKKEPPAPEEKAKRKSPGGDISPEELFLRIGRKKQGGPERPSR